MMYRISIVEWIKIFSPAVLFTAAQFSAREFLLILGTGSKSSALATCLVCPVIVLYFYRCRNHIDKSLETSFRWQDLFLWLVATAVFVVLNLLVAPMSIDNDGIVYLIASVVCGPDQRGIDLSWPDF